MANRRFVQFFNTLHDKPVLLDCMFTVDNTQALGISNLKGPGIEAVYMHSAAATPAGLNPIAGNIVVVLQDNYTRYYGGFDRIEAPTTGSDLSSLNVGQVYVISLLGDTTLAQWQTAGLPVGITPALGVPFVAAANISGTGRAKAVGNSNIDSIENCGDAQSGILSSSKANIIGVQSGSYLIFQCLKSDVLTAPTNGSIIHLAMYFGNSRILVQGE